MPNDFSADIPRKKKKGLITVWSERDSEYKEYPANPEKRSLTQKIAEAWNKLDAAHDYDVREARKHAGYGEDK